MHVRGMSSHNSHGRPACARLPCPGNVIAPYRGRLQLGRAPARTAFVPQAIPRVNISDSRVWRTVRRLKLNRLPAPQKCELRRRCWKRYEKQQPGHQVQIDVRSSSESRVPPAHSGFTRSLRYRFVEEAEPPRPEDHNVVCIARRTRIPADHIPTGRARKRRTIPKDQLTLALEGRLDYVFGYSFILTNLDVDDPEKLAELEWWYRHRTDIEALNKDAKFGAALRHLPSANHRVNTVWMWAALLACAISAWTQELTRIDRGNGRGRRTLTRFRREVINVPARLTRRGGITYLRLPPGDQLLATVLPRLQELSNPG